MESTEFSEDTYHKLDHLGIRESPRGARLKEAQKSTASIRCLQ
jgi:hypothetical protein